jgi:hypothetical protein
MENVSDFGAASPKSSAEIAFRRTLLSIAAAAALVAMFAGLSRLGLGVPLSSHAMDHGPILVVGVFGTLIALERAVALGQLWAYSAPLFGALAALAMLGTFRQLGALLAFGSALVIIAVNAAIVRRQSANYTWLMLIASLALAFGSGSWALGEPVATVVPAWLVFFVLTIVAERLELSRLGRTPVWASRLLVVLGFLVALTAVGALAAAPVSVRLMGGLLALIACWELRFDLARRTLRSPGLPRFVALAVLLGVAWLLVAGLALLLFGLPPAGPVYDAILHAIFVGFVLSMVFAHAPIILPAVARVRLPFHRAFYLPLGLLHIALVCRMIGDFVGLPGHRQVGAAGNAIALGLFVVTALWAHSSQGRRSIVPAARAPSRSGSCARNPAHTIGP